MKRPSFSEADVSCGQMLLTLRSALDLTQAELARTAWGVTASDWGVGSREQVLRKPSISNISLSLP